MGKAQQRPPAFDGRVFALSTLAYSCWTLGDGRKWPYPKPEMFKCIERRRAGAEERIGTVSPCLQNEEVLFPFQRG
jgi:hypothetical protein